MVNLESLLIKLKSGTRKEKGEALAGLAGLSDPKAIDALGDFFRNSDSSGLFLTACCALAAGCDSREEAVGKISPHGNPAGQEMLRFQDEIRAEPDFLGKLDIFAHINEIEESHRAFCCEHPAEAREKLQKQLDFFNRRLRQHASSGLSFFDSLIAFASKRAIGLILVTLGLVELRLGNMNEALSLGEKALAIGNEIQDREVLSAASGNLGVAYMEMDRYYESLDHFRKSLEAMGENICPWRKKNRVLYNMALLYYKIGDFCNSLKFARDALDEARKERDDLGTGRCLNAIGIASLNLERDGEAEEYFLEALENCKKTGDRQTEGNALINLGRIHKERKDYRTASDLLYRALKIFEDLGNKSTAATVNVGLANLYLARADTAKAHERALEALRLAGDTASRKDDADACYILGSISHFYYQDRDAAYDYYGKAIGLYEAIRRDLVADDLKITFAEHSASCYEQMVSLCVGLGRKDEAFEYVERSKSRALVELLSKTIGEIEPRRAAPERIKEAERIKNTLAALERELRSLYKRSRTAGACDDERTGPFFEPGEIYPGLLSIERQYKEAYEELKTLAPEFATFAGVEPVNIEELRKLLDRDTILVEYYLTDRRIFIFLLSPESEINVCQAEIDIKEESERVALLSGNLRGHAVCSVESHDFYKGVKFPLAALYDLLIGPIEENIKNAKRLVIAPHLFLHYLPFHALFDRKRNEYLTDRFEIAYAPSAEVLKYCYKKNDPTRKSAVIFANPTGDLPYAEEEARKIAELFEPYGRLYIGKEATLENLELIDDADIVHLACHGLYRNDEPIFSHLLFTDTEEGQGRFFLPNIFNLKLKTPTLVTLSACESGLSRFSSGDELIGFARGFFYAGAPSIIASLWRVDDKSTSLFMEVFYRNIKNLLPKSKAIQLAIHELKARPEYRHPYFWAPFVLMGDWI